MFLIKLINSLLLRALLVRVRKKKFDVQARLHFPTQFFFGRFSWTVTSVRSPGRMPRTVASGFGLILNRTSTTLKASFDKEKDPEYDKLFTISPPEEWKGFDFSDVIRGRDDKPWGGSGFQAGDKHDSALSFQGGSSMSISSNAKFERVVGDPFLKVTFLSN